jgi:hypothetical protein
MKAKTPVKYWDYYKRYPGERHKRCGAKTRKGTPCMRREIWLKGRCRNHGGLSTGPKTEEGLRRSIAARVEGYQRFCEERRKLKASKESGG